MIDSHYSDPERNLTFSHVKVLTEPKNEPGQYQPANRDSFPTQFDQVPFSFNRVAHPTPTKRKACQALIMDGFSPFSSCH